MSDLHKFSVLAANQELIEAVSPDFVVEEILEAQAKTWSFVPTILNLLKEGMTELEARHCAVELFKNAGVEKHWHQPYIRFGEGTRLSFRNPLQADYKLKLGDPLYVDLGPVWKSARSGLEYEADVGDSFVFGAALNPEFQTCQNDTRLIFNEAKKKWLSDETLSGEGLYSFIKRRADELGYDLLESVDGHRVSDFPHQKYSRERLAKIPFKPSRAIWVLEIQLLHRSRSFGAFFEDLLV